MTKATSMKKVFDDPVEFAKYFLKFKPHPYQAKFMRDCATKKRVVGIMPRQAGKSYALAAFCVYWACVVPGQRLLLVAPTQRQSKNLFSYMKAFLRESAWIREQVMDDFAEEMRFKNTSKIKAMPCGADGKTIRGETADIIILEESAYIKDNIVHEVILPMIAATNGSIIQIGTPVGRNHFWEATRINPITNVADYKVHQINYTDCLKVGQYNVDFINEQKKLLGFPSPAFSREYEAKFTETQYTALSWDLIMSCVNLDFRIPHSYQDIPRQDNMVVYVGMDIGRFTSRTVFTVLTKHPETGQMKLLWFKEYAQTKYAEQQGILRNILMYFQPVKTMLDSTGAGRVFYEELKEDRFFQKFSIIPVEFQTKSKEQMFNNLRELLNKKLIKLPNEQSLLNQMQEQEVKVNAVGREIYNPPDGTFDDILWSLCLGCFGSKKGNVQTYGRLRR